MSNPAWTVKLKQLEKRQTWITKCKNHAYELILEDINIDVFELCLAMIKDVKTTLELHNFG
jgi:hypothetical protein